jgi:hypothetical protein
VVLVPCEILYYFNMFIEKAELKILKCVSTFKVIFKQDLHTSALHKSNVLINYEMFIIGEII